MSYCERFIHALDASPPQSGMAVHPDLSVGPGGVNMLTAQALYELIEKVEHMDGRLRNVEAKAWELGG